MAGFSPAGIGRKIGPGPLVFLCICLAKKLPIDKLDNKSNAADNHNQYGKKFGI